MTRVRRAPLRAVLAAAALLCAMAAACFWGLRHYYRSAYPIRYSEYVEKYAAEYGVDPAFVYAMIKTESDFNPNAVSVNDACGLMQLLPDTLDWLQRLTPEDDHYTRADLFDPEVNIRYGVYFVHILFDEFHDPETVAAAYHAGINGVKKWLQNPDYSSDGVHLDRIPYADTAQYAERIVRYLHLYQKLYHLE